MSVDKTADTDKAPTTSNNIPYTGFVVTGSNPVIIVAIALAHDTAVITSISTSGFTSIGTPIELGTIRSGGSSPLTFLSLWAIPAPVGTGDFTVNLSASCPWQSNAILLSGADQTTPCPTGVGNVGTATGGANPLSITLSNLAAGEIGVAIGAQNTDGDAPSFDHDDVNTFQTFINNTSLINASVGYRKGAGAMTVTWGSISATDVMVAARVVAASGSTPRFILGTH